MCECGEVSWGFVEASKKTSFFPPLSSETPSFSSHKRPPEVRFTVFHFHELSYKYFSTTHACWEFLFLVLIIQILHFPQILQILLSDIKWTSGQHKVNLTLGSSWEWESWENSVEVLLRVLIKDWCTQVWGINSSRRVNSKLIQARIKKISFFMGKCQIFAIWTISVCK